MKICVVGSLNVDLTVEVDRFPKKGQTVRGKSFNTYFGGKGGNQAVAARKLKMDVTMLGSIGNDEYGKKYLKYLDELGVNTDIVKVNSSHTGLAMIEVEASGENKIITVGGSNYLLNNDWIDSNLEKILDNDIYLFSLEIPSKTVLHLLKILKRNNKTIILDPAPASNFLEEMLEYVDYITPNETEFTIVTGRNNVDMKCLEEISESFVNNTMILKVGKCGSYYIHNNELYYEKGFSVNTIDTVAAGDSFNAGLAYAIANGYSEMETLKFANAVGAMSTKKSGAQSGMPTLDEVICLLK